MSGAKRKVHGAEFKAKVGLEAIHGVKTLNQIAQEHGVHPVQEGERKLAGVMQRTANASRTPAAGASKASRVTAVTSAW